MLEVRPEEAEPVEGDPEPDPVADLSAESAEALTVDVSPGVLVDLSAAAPPDPVPGFAAPPFAESALPDADDEPGAVSDFVLEASAFRPPAALPEPFPAEGELSAAPPVVAVSAAVVFAELVESADFVELAEPPEAVDFAAPSEPVESLLSAELPAPVESSAAAFALCSLAASVAAASFPSFDAPPAAVPEDAEEAALGPPFFAFSVAPLSLFEPAESPLSGFALSDFPPVFADPVPPEPDPCFAESLFDPADGFRSSCFDRSDAPVLPLPPFDAPEEPEEPLDASPEDPAEVSPPWSRAVAA
ncbi:hypothetical protein LP52_11435 [Streptomonospora alba]|uniref:Uncharacterized protein n=1 Tax=Streptomonospora alba TaxID=183763 RepID=A0A0C2JBC0_9ACTN|nr:hypothetical protein LP52_11435 [Streptomonospora alba]